MAWNIDGMIGEGQLPPQAGQFSGKLLIMGGARCVWDDIARAGDAQWPGDRMTINDITAYYQGPVQHAVSLHEDYLLLWTKLRMAHGYGNGVKPMLHGYRSFPEMDAVWQGLEQIGGTSGLFAALIAVCLGYDRITLAGLPMDGTGHFFDPPPGHTKDDYWWVHFDQDSSLKTCWIQANGNYFKNRVRSLSGWTSHLCGEPTEEWLK